jgi:hypothetical protein
MKRIIRQNEGSSMKTAAFTFVLAFVTALAPSVNAQQNVTRPAQILLIRHAEKPTDTNDIHLTAQGKKRADALPELFKKSDKRPEPFPKPDFLFAAKQSKHSNRSFETLTPLAKELGLKLNIDFADEEFASLAAELLSNPKYAGKTILVCWHHGRIPKLAEALKATEVPSEFTNIFDRVWVVRYDEMGNGKPLVKRPQNLMPGDSTE